MICIWISKERANLDILAINRHDTAGLKFSLLFCQHPLACRDRIAFHVSSEEKCVGTAEVFPTRL